MKAPLKSMALRLTTRKTSEKAKVSDISELLFVKTCSTIQARKKSATGNKEFYQGSLITLGQTGRVVDGRDPRSQHG
jgi:hypothetical protein